MGPPVGGPARVVIAVGNDLRRDDGVGPAVVARVEEALPADVGVVVVDGEPSRLVDAWTGTAVAVVVDAVRSGAPAGTVHRLRVHPDGEPLPAPGRGASSSHAAGVAEAVALGRALERMPGRLVVVGVEVAAVGDGPGLSGPVAAAVPAAVAAVQAEVADGPAIEGAPVEAWRVRIGGIVQGVGFRPFVWRLADRLGLRGWVRNGPAGVEVHVEGASAPSRAFLDEVARGAPPSARVTSVEVVSAPVLGCAGFEVAVSETDAGPERRGVVPPDRAPCAACASEVVDVGDRRHGHPFASCTECGPRATIIEDLPYDRARTTMAPFPRCPRCEAEYHDPTDRRFHAEPIACPACGPRLELVGRAGAPVPGDPVVEAARIITGGGVVTMKDVGGYQLACDATDEAAVARLRARKRRPDKPLAVLVADEAAASRWARPTAEERALLGDPAAPIVLVAGGEALAPSVAPGHRRVGLVLPASPLHLLLARAVGRPVVLTSGNRSEEPIAIDDDDALDRLDGIADAWLRHDRRIAARADDSVAVVRRGAPAVLRRARGFAPAPVRLGQRVDGPVLGVGGDLQAAWCIVDGDEAHPGAHVGDLDDERTIVAWRDALDHHLRRRGPRPVLVARDLHPDLTSSRLAEQLAAEWEVPLVAVQHHHAHVEAVRAEHAVGGAVVGLALDGFGLGADGSAWGGEVLVVSDQGATRAGHLRTVPLVGGDRAVREPVRMALAHAAAAGCRDEAAALLGVDAGVPAAGPAAGTPTSSAGRLFDAVAVLCGITPRPTHEGQPAMLLEQLAVGEAGHVLPPMAVDDGGDGVVIDPRPVVEAVVAARREGVPAGEVAAGFHVALADALVAAAGAVASSRRIEHVCLAGGVWANDLLADRVHDGLDRLGLVVHLPRAVPPGDGGLALGQAVVAARRGAGWTP